MCIGNGKRAKIERMLGEVPLKHLVKYLQVFGDLEREVIDHV